MATGTTHSDASVQSTSTLVIIAADTNCTNQHELLPVPAVSFPVPFVIIREIRVGLSAALLDFS